MKRLAVIIAICALAPAGCAGTDGEYCVTVGAREASGTRVGSDGAPYNVACGPHERAMMSRADYWSGTPNCRDITEARQIPLTRTAPQGLRVYPPPRAAGHACGTPPARGYGIRCMARIRRRML